MASESQVGAGFGPRLLRRDGEDGLPVGIVRRDRDIGALHHALWHEGAVNAFRPSIGHRYAICRALKLREAAKSSRRAVEMAGVTLELG